MFELNEFEINQIRIYRPYGIERNANGKWLLFNRDYYPVKFDKQSFISLNREDYFEKYHNLSESKLNVLETSRIERNEDGSIFRLWFYDESSNPVLNKKNFDKFRRTIIKLEQILKE